MTLRCPTHPCHSLRQSEPIEHLSIAYSFLRSNTKTPSFFKVLAQFFISGECAQVATEPLSIKIETLLFKSRRTEHTINCAAVLLLHLYCIAKHHPHKLQCLRFSTWKVHISTFLWIQIFEKNFNLVHTVYDLHANFLPLSDSAGFCFTWIIF